MGRIWDALTKGRIDGVIVIDGKPWIHRESPWYKSRKAWSIGLIIVAAVLAYFILGCDPPTGPDVRPRCGSGEWGLDSLRECGGSR